MNTKNLKAYAPKARRQFMEAVAKRAAHFGIYEDEVAPVSFQGSTAIIEGNAFTKQQGEQRKRLEKRIEEKPLATHKERYDLFVREMAYTWFNRLAALRYMELHDYFEHGFRVLSHPTNQDGLPEILDHAADVADMLGLDKAQIIEWQLAGDKQELLYRELLLGQCHHLHNVMPFLFEAIDDATELLLPDNLTKTDSILKGLISDIPEEDWEQIEVIGWLYQFYISEHKDAVIGKVVKSEDLPAATQLFTPNWIVKYLVQNSIGRQWLATYPDSSIKAKMEYYIEPAEQTDEVNAQLATITPSSIDPESIKALDPACGSGHILVEMYELLREIYLERGYRLREIPELILTKNIYGLDIDDRAAQLAGFALLMKAREDDRRIFQRVQDGSVKLNVYALQSTEGWDSASLWQALNLDGKAKQGSSGDLFVETKKFDAPTGEYAEYFDLLKYLIMSFEQSKTLGSLIQIDNQYLPTLRKFKSELLNKLKENDPATASVARQLLPVIEQTIVLAQKYCAVCANPPYVGSKYQSPEIKKYLKDNFKGYEKDLFSAFIIRNLEFARERGELGFMTPFVWMFISSYEQLRNKIISDETLSTLIQLEYSGFDGATVPICTFTLTKGQVEDFVSSFIRLSDFRGAKIQATKTLEAIKNRNCGWLYEASQSGFKRIAGNPIGYWASDSVKIAFDKGTPLRNIAVPRQGLATMDNSIFTREWHEVDACNIGLSGYDHSKKWFPYNKGGDYRKWFGNQGLVVNWQNNGQDIKTLSIKRYGSASKRVVNESSYFKESVTWSKISSGIPSFRYQPSGAIFDVAGMSIFPEDKNDIYFLLAVLNSRVVVEILKILSPTLNFEAGQIASIPVIKPSNEIIELVKLAIENSKLDWDSFEYSWDFAKLDVLEESNTCHLKGAIAKRVQYWVRIAQNQIEAEQKIDQICCDAYGVNSSFGREVAYRESFKRDYLSGNRGMQSIYSEMVYEVLSYFVGCAFGRYSLDQYGLIFAGSNNEGFGKLVDEGAYKTFPADDDGIIPLASEEWLFGDDATARFREFVKVVWGEEHIQENLEFIAESLCLNAIKPKKGESAMETIRRYFSTQFFADHCKMYKKRPIYWLFSSGKEKAFECLVYLHRYNEATLSRMRTEYVTPLMGKYDHQLARKMDEVVEATGTEQRRIEKEIKDLEKKQAELRKFDEELKHYAEMRISLDLDDGVKANYGKFGNLLANVKAIHGKAVK